jgi:hypothetical protein
MIVKLKVDQVKCSRYNPIIKKKNDHFCFGKGSAHPVARGWDVWSSERCRELGFDGRPRIHRGSGGEEGRARSRCNVVAAMGELGLFRGCPRSPLDIGGGGCVEGSSETAGGGSTKRWAGPDGAVLRRTCAMESKRRRRWTCSRNGLVAW